VLKKEGGFNNLEPRAPTSFRTGRLHGIKATVAVVSGTGDEKDRKRIERLSFTSKNAKDWCGSCSR